MMKQKIISLSISLLLIYTCYSQSGNPRKQPVVFGGVGAGLDYGGIGIKIEYLPVKRIGVFAGAGFNFNKAGVNGGVSWKAFADNKSTPVIMAMYGYNAVLKVRAPFGNGITFSETYYGFSAGIGYEFLVGENRNKISLALIIPVRGNDFKNQYDAFKSAGYSFNPDISPVLATIGFNIAGYGK